MGAMSQAPKYRRPFIERTSTALLFLLVIFAVGVGIGAILAKVRPPIQLPPAKIEVVATPSTDPALLKTGDELEIFMSEIAGPGSKTTKRYKVDDKGEIFIPLLGPLGVSGHTARQTEEAIAQGYKDRHVSSNVQVEVRRVLGASSAPALK